MPLDIIIKSTTRFTIRSIIYLSIHLLLWNRKTEELSDSGTELNNPNEVVVRFLLCLTYVYYNSFVERNKTSLFVQNNTSARKFAFRSSNVRPTVRNLLWGLAALFIITIPLYFMLYSIKRGVGEALFFFFFFVTIARQLRKLPPPLPS